MKVSSLPTWIKITVPSLALVAGTGVFALSAAGAATSLPPGTIHGCVYLKSNRTMERVYTNPAKGTTCPKGTFQAVWGIQGPQGPAGPQGPKGDPGVANVQADEPYGNDVDPNPNVAQSNGKVPAGQTAVVWAACPSGKTALGGGFRIGNGTSADAAESDSTGAGYSGSDVQVLASEPSYYDAASGKLSLAAAPQVTSYGSYLPNAWAVTVHNNGTADANARVALVCADVTKPAG